MLTLHKSDDINARFFDELDELEARQFYVNLDARDYEAELDARDSEEDIIEARAIEELLEACAIDSFLEARAIDASLGDLYERDPPRTANVYVSRLFAARLI